MMRSMIALGAFVLGASPVLAQNEMVSTVPMVTEEIVTTETPQAKEQPVATTSQEDSYSGKARFDSIDANGDGVLSPKELTAWRSDKFRARDLNRDGSITREELMQMADDGGRPMTYEESTSFLITFDINGDSIVTHDEVSQVIAGSNVFEMLDLDGSGFVSRSEAAAWLDVTPTASEE